MTKQKTLTDPSFDKTMQQLGFGVVTLGTLFPKLLYWSLKTGAPIVSGFLGLYLFLVCVESYYRALPVGKATVGNAAEQASKAILSAGEGEKIEVDVKALTATEEVESRPAFIPKPGINDGASFSNISQVNGPELILCLFVALFIQSMQSSFQRGKTPEEAKRAYEKAAKHHVSDTAPDNRIKLVGVRHKEYQKSGLASRRRNGALIGLSYLIDGGAAVAAFSSTLFSGIGGFAIAGVWGLSAVIGPELCLGWMQDRLEDQKEALKDKEKGRSKGVDNNDQKN